MAHLQISRFDENAWPFSDDLADKDLVYHNFSNGCSLEIICSQVRIKTIEDLKQTVVDEVTAVYGPLRRRVYDKF